VKYLETFSKVNYHQINRLNHECFRNYFAEKNFEYIKVEITTNQRNEKFDRQGKRGGRHKTISDSALLAKSSMTSEESDARMEKIMSEEIRGTTQDIQNLSASKVSKKSQRTSCDFENCLNKSVVEENS